MTYVKRRKGWRMSYDVGEVTEMLEIELCSFSKLSVTSATSQLILQPFRRFTYVTVHSPILPLLHLCHSSFSNPSYVTGSSLNATWRAAPEDLPFNNSDSPILPLLHLRHSSFSNHSFASLMSQALHLTPPREPPVQVMILWFVETTRLCNGKKNYIGMFYI